MPQELHTGVLWPPGAASPDINIDASPFLALTAPTPVGLGAAPPRGPPGAGGDGCTVGENGLGAVAWPPCDCPGVQTPGLDAEIKNKFNTLSLC